MFDCPQIWTVASLRDKKRKRVSELNARPTDNLMNVNYLRYVS